MDIIGLENINEQLSTHFIIYRMVNNINGKYYIGQHKTENCLDEYSGSGTLICKAKDRYGLSAFTKEILFDFADFESMNRKEEELVQLSNCYPQDPMSYNLTVGGNGGNKFSSKTADELKEIFAKVKNTRDNWSPAQKAIAHANQSVSSKLMWENKTDEELAEISQHLSEVQTEIWSQRTDEEKAAIAEKCSQTKRNYTPERKQEIYEKRQTTCSNKTEEEKQLTHDKQSAAAKKREANKTEEERNAQIAKQKNTWENKTDEEIQEGVSKWRISMSNRTEEQKAETAEKRKIARNSRTEEQKLATKNKFHNTLNSRSLEQQLEVGTNISNGLKKSYAEHPERAKKHSEQMTGNGNPAYGRKWMNDGIHRVFVKAEEIQLYIDMGYHIGWLNTK